VDEIDLQLYNTPRRVLVTEGAKDVHLLT